MDYTSFLSSEIFSLAIVPLLIFFARVLDVSLGTIRIIYVSRGRKYLAPLLGFFEIMIWLLAISQIMQNFTNSAYYIAYAGGFAMGNFIGIYIEDKLAMGTLAIRIITMKDSNQLIEHLTNDGYGVTSVDALGSTGKVKIIFTVIKRKNLQEVMEIVKKFNPKAFFSIEEVRSVSEGVFPVEKPTYERFLRSIRYKRK